MRDFDQEFKKNLKEIYKHRFIVLLFFLLMIVIFIFGVWGMKTLHKIKIKGYIN